jgi:hypothetical protein
MVEEIARLPASRLGTIHTVLVGVVDGHLTIEDYEQQERFQAQFLEKQGKCSTLWVIRRAVRPSDDRAGEKVKQISERFKTQVRGSAVVITATGAAAVLTRTFMSALGLIMNPDPPMKSFRTVKDGVAWLQALPGQDPVVVNDLALDSAIEAFASAEAWRPGA